MTVFPKILLAGAAVFCAALVVPLPAKANDVLVIPKKDGGSAEDVKGSCDGGTYFPPSSENGGVYGCINDNGSGIVCGGLGSMPTPAPSFLSPPSESLLSLSCNRPRPT